MILQRAAAFQVIRAHCLSSESVSATPSMFLQDSYKATWAVFPLFITFPGILAVFKIFS